jgi:general stress protein CsbA
MTKRDLFLTLSCLLVVGSWYPGILAGSWLVQRFDCVWLLGSVPLVSLVAGFLFMAKAEEMEG